MISGSTTANFFAAASFYCVSVIRQLVCISELPEL